MAGKLISGLVYQPLTARCLTEETCAKWGYGVGTYKGKAVQVANYWSADGSRVVAQKVRFPDKDFLMLGNPEEAGLYGQHLWRDGGRMVVITEGEVDALSVSQVENHKWPVVSVPSGAKGAKKALQKNLDWLERFETVVLMFDSDEPGREAAAECAELFVPGKCKVASLPLKDANEMLKAGRGKEIVSSKWEAKTHRPDGIVNGTDLWELLVTEPPNDSVPFPFGKLQSMTRGMRRGEVITFTSGTGMGKTEIVRQVYYTLHRDHGETLGLIHLEENLRRTIQGMVGLELGKRLHIYPQVEKEELKKAFEKTIGSGRVYLYDHFGSTQSDNLFNKIRFFVKGCGCTTIVLDHISIVVSGLDDKDGDERRLLDILMTRLETLAQELNCRIIIISHLKKPDGTPFEEGGQISINHLRGSYGIAQCSHTIVALERNQQDEERKHFTRIRLLKCRFTGETGEAGWLKYDTETGRLEEADAIFEPEETY